MKIRIFINCGILVCLLLVGCGNEQNMEKREQVLTVEKNEHNLEYMEKYKGICEELVRLKMEKSMRRKSEINYNRNTIKEKYKDLLINCDKTLDILTGQEHINIDGRVFGLPENFGIPKNENIVMVENNIYNALQYDVDTRTDNNIVFVDVSLRCIDDKAMKEEIEKNIRSRLEKTFPQYYKKDMWIQNLVHKAWEIPQKTKDRIDVLRYRTNGRLTKAEKKELEELSKVRFDTDVQILEIFYEEFLKAYKKPIYMSEKNKFSFQFIIKNDRNNQGDSQSKIEYIPFEKCDINRMFWLGQSSKNASKYEAIDGWISEQCPYMIRNYR